MLKSLLLGLFATVAVAVFAQTTWAAEDKTHDGFVVSVAEGKLTMADKDGKNEHTTSSRRPPRSLWTARPPSSPT